MVVISAIYISCVDRARGLWVKIELMDAHKNNIEYLIELARDRSVHSQNELVTVIKDLFQD